MLTQHKVQLDLRERNPAVVRPPANPYVVRSPAPCLSPTLPPIPFPARLRLHLLSQPSSSCMSHIHGGLGAAVRLCIQQLSA